VLVALATTGVIPAYKSVGKVRNEPPPATEFRAPAKAATTKRRSVNSGNLIVSDAGDAVTPGAAKEGPQSGFPEEFAAFVITGLASALP
jgi:hypothetical protein